MNENVRCAAHQSQQRCFKKAAAVIALLVSMVFCTVLAFTKHQLPASALGLSATLLWCGACTAIGCGRRSWRANFANAEAIRAERVELRNLEAREDLGYIFDYYGQDIIMALGAFVIGLTWSVAMTVAYRISSQGHGWPTVFIWLFPVVAPCSCCFGLVAVTMSFVASDLGLGPAVLTDGATFLLALHRPRRQSLHAIFSTNQHTIVLEGDVISGRNTVASWPAKCGSA